MAIQAKYLDMPLDINDLDVENLAYFKHCAAHDFHLQQCSACGLVRYPPTTACPWCASPGSDWVSVEGRGAVHSYTEVHHAIQPAFKRHTPYLILLVDLDTQKGRPSEHEALRVVGNLMTPEGKLALIRAEQAKGKLAERLSIDMDHAFGLLRAHARSTNQRLTDVARNFVDSPSADLPPPLHQGPHNPRPATR